MLGVPSVRRVLSGVGTQILCPHIFTTPGKTSKEDAGKWRGEEVSGVEASWGLLRPLHSGNLLYHWLPSPKAWRKRGELHNFEGSLLSSHRTDPGPTEPATCSLLPL